jgi:hypothetical protein
MTKHMDKPKSFIQKCTGEIQAGSKRKEKEREREKERKGEE